MPTKHSLSRPSISAIRWRIFKCASEPELPGIYVGAGASGTLAEQVGLGLTLKKRGKDGICDCRLLHCPRSFLGLSHDLPLGPLKCDPEYGKIGYIREDPITSTLLGWRANRLGWRAHRWNSRRQIDPSAEPNDGRALRRLSTAAIPKGVTGASTRLGFALGVRLPKLPEFRIIQLYHVNYCGLCRACWDSKYPTMTDPQGGGGSRSCQ